MVIDKNLMGNIYAADVGGEQITDALNAIQRAYDEYMGPAWEKMEKEGKEENAQDIAARGFSFTIATGAFHILLAAGAPKEMLEMLKAAVQDTFKQMRDQIRQKQDEKHPEAKA